MFSPAQQQAFLSMRMRYTRDPDLFSEAERDQLHFVRWLYEGGRLVP
jgi:hypothetical protein